MKQKLDLTRWLFVGLMAAIAVWLFVAASVGAQGPYG